MIGHSVGELVAACLAGVFTLEDALAVIAERGRLMQRMLPGAMLSVRLSEARYQPFLNAELALAAVNSPRLCVVSGPVTAIDDLQSTLNERGVGRATSGHQSCVSFADDGSDHRSVHGFHAREFLSAPAIALHFRRDRNVDHRAGIDRSALLGPTFPSEPCNSRRGSWNCACKPRRVFLEVGPGSTLCTLVRQHRNAPGEPVAVTSLPGGTGPADLQSLCDAAGRLWLNGVSLDWSGMYDHKPARTPLPTYPFERKRYWIAPPTRTIAPKVDVESAKRDDLVPPEISSMEKVMSDESSREELTQARSDRIRAALADIFEDLSGLSLAQADRSASFLELGFDSLFLTQVTQALQAKFGLKITFRQLLDRESTLDALTAYVAGNTPPELFASKPAIEAPAGGVPAAVAGEANGVTVPASADQVSFLAPANLVPASSAMEAIVREQLQAMSQLMSKQLDVLRGVGASPVAIAGPEKSLAVRPSAVPAPAAAVTTPAAPSRPRRSPRNSSLSARTSPSRKGPWVSSRSVKLGI